MTILRDIAPGEETRRCAQCDACCVAVAVEEIAKPEQERCDHQTSTGKPGCAIYDERPLSCRVWSCAWLQGFGTSNDRPDKLGLIFDAIETIGGPTIQAREVWAGAFYGNRAAGHLMRFSERMPVVLMRRDGGRGLIGPPEVVRRMWDAVRDGTAEAGGGFVPNCQHNLTRSQCRPCMEADVGWKGGER